MGVITAKIYDLLSNELADISPICFEPTLTRRLNHARQLTFQSIPGHSLLTGVAGDGYRNLRKGNRKLIVWEDDLVVFHGRIFTVERTGDGTSNNVAVTAFDPFMELGFDGDNRAGRYVRDANANFIAPTFLSSVDGGRPISGADLIQQILTNSQNSDSTLGEGPLPIDLSTGTFDLSVPPALDLSIENTTGWPRPIGDFITMLVETGVVDFDMRPVDPTEGLDPYVMVALSAVSSFGSDKSETVHFDYWTGDFTAAACRHVEEFGTICNKLYDYLGPAVSPTRWQGNITPGSPGTTVDPSASRALYGGDPGNPGQFMAIRVFDSVGAENTSRPLYLALWNGEQGFRVEPRDMLFITPDIVANLYTAPQDFDVGDLIAVNTGGEFGLDLAETQRIYGYTKTWDRQGVARITDLLTSADEAA